MNKKKKKTFVHNYLQQMSRYRAFYEGKTTKIASQKDGIIIKRVRHDHLHTYTHPSIYL